jgi:hypothetical protein
VPDPVRLLFEVNEAWRALEHGRAGLQRGVDPLAESERLAGAWRRLHELTRYAFPEKK